MDYDQNFFNKYREIIFGLSIGFLIAISDLFFDYIVVMQDLTFIQYIDLHFINIWQLIEHFVYVAMGLFFSILWWQKSNRYRQIRELKNELEEKKGFSDLLLDIMTHDLNNLNQNALTRAELLRHLLLDSKYEKGNVERNFDDLRRTIKFSNILIRNVKILSQLEADMVETRKIKLSPLFESAKEKVQLVFPDIPINIKLKNDTEKLEVEGHPFIENVFMNLISNSCRYRNPGLKEVSIEIEVNEVKDSVQISFIDFGRGIEDELKEKIFNRFSVIETGQHGSGLGLSISRRILEQFGGKIWVENHPDSPDDPSAGSIFKIFLIKPNTVITEV